MTPRAGAANEHPRDLIAIAWELAGEGRGDEAVALLKGLVGRRASMHPADLAGAADLLGQIALARGDFRDAESWLRRALEASPTMSGAINEVTDVSLAEALVRLGTPGGRREAAAILHQSATRPADFRFPVQVFRWCASASLLFEAVGDVQRSAVAAAGALAACRAPAPLSRGPAFGSASLGDPRVPHLTVLAQAARPLPAEYGLDLWISLAEDALRAVGPPTGPPDA